jgi:hypothetical protein
VPAPLAQEQSQLLLPVVLPTCGKYFMSQLPIVFQSLWRL